MTVGWPRSTPNARSWSPGSSPDGASPAGRSTRWKSTTSPSSQTSDDQEPGHRGQISWPHDIAKPLWSAEVVTRTSTARSPPQHSRSSHWKAMCGESRMRRLGWGPWEKDLLSRHLADGPPVPSGTAWHGLARSSTEGGWRARLMLEQVRPTTAAGQARGYHNGALAADPRPP